MMRRKRLKRMWLILIVSVMGYGIQPLTAGTVRSLADIEFWVGSGPNQAALAIDWQGQSPESESLVWGYRWDGTATTADMLLDIVRADPRMYAKTGPVGSLGLAVYGLGYDASADAEFQLNDGTLFDNQGLAVSGPADLAQPVNPQDWYQEGWFLGFWHHGVASGAPANWVSGPGVSNRSLSDGDWDSLAFTLDLFDQTSFASGLNASQATTLPGDFDRNGQVNELDLVRWRSELGNDVFLPGFGADGNADQHVRYDDFLVWQRHFGESLPNNQTIPEPPISCWCPFVIMICAHLLRKLR